jgi:hypothetical protein
MGKAEQLFKDAEPEIYHPNKILEMAPEELDDLIDSKELNIDKGIALDERRELVAKNLLDENSYENFIKARQAKAKKEFEEK